MYNDRSVSIRIDEYMRLATEMLMAAGCNAERARILAEVHLDSDLCGVGVQGMNHLVFDHIPHMLTGRIEPNAEPEIIKDNNSYVLIDGNRCPGPIAVSFGVEVSTSKARASGCCMVGIRNTDFIFRLGFYAEQLANRGLISLIFSDDPVPVVHPTGGSEPVIGTNPMAIGIPADNVPFVADFTPCATIPTWIRYSRIYHDELQKGWATDELGKPTTDPFAVTDGSDYEPHKGAINPLGHKGYGLLLVIDFLSGALVGADMGLGHINAQRPNKGHFFIVINPSVFGDLSDFKSSVQRRINEVKGSRKCEGVESVKVAGEVEQAKREKSIAEGIVKLDAFLWEDVARLCRELDVAIPEIN